MEELTATQIGARLGVSERTAQRYIKSGKLKAVLQANGYYLVDTASINALKPPTLPTVTTSASALADMLNRIEALEQQVRHLEGILRAFHPQTPHISTTSKQPTPQSQEPQKEASLSHRGISEELIWLEPDVVAWRAFARLHHVGETVVGNAIREGRLPAIAGQWRRGKTPYTRGFNQEGRRRFHELYHLPLPCVLCGMEL